MLYTTNRLSFAAACMSALLVSFAVLDPSHSYTIQHHVYYRLGTGGLGDGCLNNNNSNNRLVDINSGKNNYGFTRLEMSYQPPTSEGDNTNGGGSDDDDDKKELTFYEILGASQDATRSELKKKYITLARVSHPDAQVGGNNSEGNNQDVDFQNVAEAWRTLGNPKSRRRYDRTLKAKAWGDKAQRLTNERLDQVAPLASNFMDNLAVPFLRKTSSTVGKAIKTGIAVAEAVKSATAEEEESTTRSGLGLSLENVVTDQDAEESIVANEETEIAINTASTTKTDTVEAMTPPETVDFFDPIEATIKETEINGTSITTPILETSNATIDAFDDDDTPDDQLNEKSLELEVQ